MSDSCLCAICGTCKEDHRGYKHEWMAERAKASVILFKPSGKYYTSEFWTIPTAGELEEAQKDVDRPLRVYEFQPNCMLLSPSFRRIGGSGAVLVESQEPWGFPVLFPNTPPI